MKPAVILKAVWRSLLAIMIGLMSILSVGPATPQVAAAAPGLPDHFALGLGAAPDNGGLNGWMPDTHIPWDYAYQYLSGGVNTGHGWSTWNDNAQFPVYYAKNADSHGYIPVFSYYMLLQSNGSCANCGESEKDRGNLNSQAVMQSYFQDFTLLMKRLGPNTSDGVQGFGKTAIVHVEPDLSGYVESAATGADPSSVPAAVSSTGMADLAGFPDTYQGFSWALLHLRDVYAPNVLLAFHVSPWATGTDLGSSRDPGLDALSMGAQVGGFAAASGVVQTRPGTSTYDFVFTDVNDRDASFYKLTQNDPNRWWDQLNVTYPNFERWEQFVASMAQVATKPFVVWQIPLGNQYFQSENNTPGHYQDNRAEYFFSHLDELKQVGIVALLFGPGAPGVTNYNDSSKDGVSNPPAICTSDGISSGQVCNNHVSTVADDDGGFLRMSAQQYYQNPLPLGATGRANPVPPKPQSAPAQSVAIDLGGSSVLPAVAGAGQQVTVTQNVIGSSNATLQVNFELHNVSDDVVAVAHVPNQHLIVGSVLSAWTVLTLPADLPAGQYTLEVDMVSSDGTVSYARNNAAGSLTIVHSNAAAARGSN